MMHFLPVEEIKKIENELQSAVAEFLAASQSLQKERDELEKEMLTSLEEQKIQSLKKKLL
ncbi:MAG: hypothetical protein WAV46_04885 [Candidatus Moraniibacteriota bacterium]